MPRLAERQGRPSKAALSTRIKAERKRLELSGREVARRLSISPACYRQIESVTTLPYGMLLALIRDVGMNARAIAPELFTSA